MPPNRVAEHLRTILDSEGVPFDAGALSLLARAAAGSMRDALSLTDQAIAYGSGTIREQDTRDMLGTVDQAYLLPLLDALADHDGARLMREAEAIAARGLSFDAALQDLALLLHHMALARAVPDAVGEDVPERDRLFELAQRIDAETIQLYYQIASLGRRDLEWAPDEYAGFSMTLLRMLAFAPDSGDLDATPRNPGPAAARRTGGDSPGPGRTTAPAPAAATPVKPAIASPPSRAAGGMADSPPRPPDRASGAAVQIAPAAQTTPSEGSFDGDWFGLTRRFSGAVKQLASLCELTAHGRGQLSLRLPEAHKGLLDGFGDKLRAAIRDQLGSDWRVDIALGQTQGDSPAEVTARAKAARQSEAEAAIYDDPFVQTMMREGGATILDIQPLQQ
jgi:DNA polymerase-3 subunit gamma/tau